MMSVCVCVCPTHPQVLTRLRHYLCDKIRAERHLDYLRSRRILTRDDAEEVSCRTTQTKRTAMLLDILAENPRGLDALTDSIREMRSQNFIITKITDEVQKAKNEKIESLKGCLDDLIGNLDVLFCEIMCFAFFLFLLLLSYSFQLLFQQRRQLSVHNQPPVNIFPQLHPSLPP